LVGRKTSEVVENADESGFDEGQVRIILSPQFFRSPFSAASAVRETIRLRMSKKRAETRTINVKQTMEKRMSRTIKQNG